MTDKKKRGISEIISDLMHGGPLSSTEEEETNAEGSAAEDQKESTSAPEQTEGESTDTDADAPAAKEGDEGGDTDEASKSDEDKSGEDGTGEGKEGDDDDEAAATVEIDGETYTLEQLRELKREGLRQDDYTRKTQELAAARKSFEEGREADDALAEDMVADPTMAEFVKAHPEVLPRMLKDGVNTRALLGNEKEIRGLWDDYELMLQSPTLAERFTRTEDPAETEAAEAQLRRERTDKNIGMVADALDEAVNTISQDFPEVDAEEVKTYMMDLAKIPRAEKDGDSVDMEEMIDGFSRAFNLFFEKNDDGAAVVVPTLLRDRFEMLQASKGIVKKAEDESADKHNKKIDEALSNDEGAPRIGGDGNAPVPETEKLERHPKGVDGVIHRLLGYDD